MFMIDQFDDTNYTTLTFSKELCYMKYSFDLYIIELTFKVPPPPTPHRHRLTKNFFVDGDGRVIGELVDLERSMAAHATLIVGQ